MRLRLAPSARAGVARKAHTRGTRLRGRWLLLAQIAWLATSALTLGLFIAGIPIQFTRLATACPAASCASGQLQPVSVRALHRLGLSLNFFASYAIALILIFALVYGGVAALVFWRRSDDRMALFVSLTLLIFGLLTFSGVASALAESHAGLWLPVTCLIYLGSTSFILFLFLFPDGHFAPRWTRWIALAWVIQAIPGAFFPTAPLTASPWFTAVGVAIWAIALATVIYSNVYRYRHVSSAPQRQQTKWVILGIGATAIGLLGALVVLDILDPLPTTPGSMVTTLVIDALVYGVLLLVPISIGIAMLRSHLFDVNILINRALVYGALTACVVGVYVLIVGSLNVVFQARGNLLVALLATGIVAVLFHPLRERLQRGVNRLMYGLRDEPYVVVSQMSQRLEAAVAPDAALQTVAETVAQALKLPYAAVALEEGEANQLNIAASYGTPTSELLRLPLMYQGERLGELQVALRSSGDQWTPADRHLLNELARHAGAAAHAVRLTGELQRTNAHLVAARERLVTAREEERRRLRRDLHDGLGPALAALTLKAGAARKLLTRDLQSADTLLAELGDDIHATVSDIRRLVYDLRPPTLDELGLIGAIRERATQYSFSNEELHVTVDAPDQLPALPAAVEVAAYRIAQEALTNVARHAQAQICHVSITLDGALQLEVSDDGIGLAAERPTGVGLTTMRERAVELGGTCTVEQTVPAGTRVLARLPIQKAT
jgi:signal transduction histidine kinase